MRFLFFTLLIGLSLGCRGQYSVYNADIYSGLPANHVYMVVKDSLGYLWIATTKGVVRYNGYEFKTYNLANGLATNDVWGLMLDRRQRLWLYNFSGQIGYISRNKYHSSYFRNNERTIYPNCMTPADSNMLFLTSSSLACLEEQDTIHVLSGIRGKPFMISNRTAILSHENGLLRVYGLKQGRAVELPPAGIHVDIDAMKCRWLAFEHYLLSYYVRYPELRILDLRTGTWTTRSIQDSNARPDHIVYAGINAAAKVMIICERHIYEMDSTLSMRSTDIGSLTGGQPFNGYKVTYLLEDAFWGNCLSTSSAGLYFSYPLPRRFRKLSQPGRDYYRYIGGVGADGYWWSSSANRMMRISKEGKVRYTPYPGLQLARKITPYNKQYSLISGNNACWYDHSKDRIIPLNGRYGLTSGPFRGSFMPASFLEGMWLNAAVAGPGMIFVAGGNAFGRLCLLRDTLKDMIIDQERYTDITYDSRRQLIYAYNTERILICRKDGSYMKLSSADTRLLGLKRLEQILADSEGHLYLKDCDQVIMFDPATYRYRRIATHYNLNGASLYLSGGLLVITARCGILFYHTGPGQDFSRPVLYPNIKERYYKIPQDCQLSGSELFLNTDKGLYHCSLPADSEFHAGTTDFFLASRLVAWYNDELRTIDPGDTIVLPQENANLQLDIIKASGNGQLRYKIRLPQQERWQELAGNEYNAGRLEPGRYHRVLLRAEDDNWISDPQPLYLYIRPYWWQTAKGQQLIFVAALVFLCALLLLTVYITRRIALRRNARKTQLLELEIKSVHAQINPHFIFNSLNTALHFITKDQPQAAYNHIVKFSRLLRGYLRSSRYRYISLAEELKNLQHYIELQQTRFAYAFTFSVELRDIEDPAKLQIPSLLLQPIVENAINHGLLPRETKNGHLELRFHKDPEGNTLYCSIEDNGIGRAASAALPKNNPLKEESYGDQLLKDLVHLFNRYEQIGIDISYVDKQAPFSGTIVNITIKNPHYE